jgi:hypothetical protein
MLSAAVKGGTAALGAGISHLVVLRTWRGRALIWLLAGVIGGTLGAVAGHAAGGTVTALIPGLMLNWAVGGSVYGAMSLFARRTLPRRSPHDGDTSRARPGATLFWWMFASVVTPFVGIVAGGCIAIAIGVVTRMIVPRINDSLNANNIALLVSIVTLAVSTGAIVGWGQWLVLRMDMPRSRSWIALTALGWGLGWPLALLVSQLDRGSDWSAGLLLGVIIGAFQWLFLRRRRQEASWWVVASVAGMVLSVVVGNTLKNLTTFDQGVALANGVIKLLGVYSLITGVALLWLRRCPASDLPLNMVTRWRMFWLRWVVITSVVWWLGVTLGHQAASRYAATPFFWRPAGIILNAFIISVSLASGQALALRTTVLSWRRWALATVTGLGIGLCCAALVEQTLVPQLGGRPDPIFSAALTALITGSVQWLAMYRAVAHAEWWIPASVIAWTASSVLEVISQGSLSGYSGIVSSALSGFVVTWLLLRAEQRHPFSSPTLVTAVAPSERAA